MQIEEYLQSDDLEMVRIGFTLLNNRKDISTIRKGDILRKSWLHKGDTQHFWNVGYNNTLAERVDHWYRGVVQTPFHNNKNYRDDSIGRLNAQPWYREVYLILKELFT